MAQSCFYLFFNSSSEIPQNRNKNPFIIITHQVFENNFDQQTLVKNNQSESKLFSISLHDPNHTSHVHIKIETTQKKTKDFNSNQKNTSLSNDFIISVAEMGGGQTNQPVVQ